MEDEFKNWLRNMYHDNCSERAEHGNPPYSDVDAYFRSNTTCLKRKFNKEMEKK